MFKAWLDLIVSGVFDPTSVEQEKSKPCTNIRTALVLALRTRAREITFVITSVASPMGITGAKNVLTTTYRRHTRERGNWVLGTCTSSRRIESRPLYEYYKAKSELR